MKKLRLAIIGAGQITNVTHIPNFKNMEEVEVVAVCDTNSNAAEDLAKKEAIPNWFGDYNIMLETVKPDAVLICVPNKFHCRITLDALEAGCHVYCEKPPAISVAEAKSMEMKAKEKGLILTYGFHMRHSEAVSLIREKIVRNEFGTIYASKVQWLRRRGIPGWGNFTNKELQGGGPLIDLGVHLLDIALYLLDYPEISYVCANANYSLGKIAKAGLMGQWDRNKFNVEDSLFGYIQFKNGSNLNLETSFALNMKEKDIRNINLFGDKLGASLFPLQVFGEDAGMVTDQYFPFVDMDNCHMKCTKNFVDACLKKEDLLIKTEQGTYIQKIVSAMYASAESGMPELFK